MMIPASSQNRRAGFTFVELLLALGLGVLVAGILGALIHGLLTAGNGQTSRIKGPYAARSAVRTLSREISCSYAPPVENLVPLHLSTSTEPGKPSLLLSFYMPIPGPIGADMEQITYAVESDEQEQRELQRISVPCAGPYTNSPITNILYKGEFMLRVEVLGKDNALTEWPPAHTTDLSLPTSLRLTLTLPGQDPIETEVLIQSSLGVQSPLEREPVQPESEAAEN